MISLIIPEAGRRVLAVSANGYGKRTESADFPVHNRGGQGVIAMQTSARTITEVRRRRQRRALKRDTPRTGGA